MDCPNCGNKSKVLDSRTQEDDSTKRKRRCLVCNYGYWTTERLLSEWEKLWDATPKKQPQTTQKKVVQRAAAKPKRKNTLASLRIKRDRPRVNTSLGTSYATGTGLNIGGLA